MLLCLLLPACLFHPIHLFMIMCTLYSRDRLQHLWIMLKVLWLLKTKAWKICMNLHKFFITFLCVCFFITSQLSKNGSIECKFCNLYYHTFSIATIIHECLNCFSRFRCYRRMHVFVSVITFINHFHRYARMDVSTTVIYLIRTWS